MQYKTITLELMQQHTELYDRLLKGRTLLPALEYYAGELRENHLDWKVRLAEALPGSDPSQVASEALEIALKELEGSLASASPLDETGPLSLDAAMAFITRHTPPA